MANGAGVTAEKVVKDIRRKTRRRFSAEEKIRIVLERLRGEESTATLCRREGVSTNLYTRRSAEFLEAAKKQLQGDTRREATSNEVSELPPISGSSAGPGTTRPRPRTTTRARSWRGSCRRRWERLTSPTLDLARAATGADRVRGELRPRLLSDNGPFYVSAKFHTYLAEHVMEHTRGAPYHPMTQGTIERHHRSMKNVVKLENCYAPPLLERSIARVVEYTNHRRYHEALGNVAPADMYSDPQQAIWSRCERIKRETLARRKRELEESGIAAQMKGNVSLAKRVRLSELL